MPQVSRGDWQLSWASGRTTKRFSSLNTFKTRDDERDVTPLIKELDKTSRTSLESGPYLNALTILFIKTNYHIHYFEMRRAQNRILLDMAGIVNTCRLAAAKVSYYKLSLKQSKQLSQENLRSWFAGWTEEYFGSLSKTADFLRLPEFWNPMHASFSSCGLETLLS